MIFMIQKQNQSLLPGFTGENSIKVQKNYDYLIGFTRYEGTQLIPQSMHCPWATKESCEYDNPCTYCERFGSCWLPV
jgi:hypothetical protein